MKKLVFTVGNELMGDDAAGPLLARRLEGTPLPDWDVLDGGNTPENFVHRIREMKPERVVLVDTADMELPAGEMRLIDREAIGSLFLMTTHSLPLGFLMDAIGEFVPKVELIGIQPQAVAFGYPVSGEVSRAVDAVYSWLQGGGELTGAAQSMDCNSELRAS